MYKDMVRKVLKEKSWQLDSIKLQTAVWLLGIAKTWRTIWSTKGEMEIVWEIFVQVTPTERRFLFCEGGTKSLSLKRMFFARPIRASYRLMEFNTDFLTVGMDLWNFNASFLISEKIDIVYRLQHVTFFPSFLIYFFIKHLAC